MPEEINNSAQPGQFSSLEDLIAIMNPEVHMNLKTAIELGRWANGDRLSTKQREHCLQAVIAYENRHLEPKNRIGFIDTRRLKKSNSESPEQPQPVSLKWSKD